jgi:cobalt/nickel transport system permease protein
MVGSLFIRSFERSDRIYTAMLSRGYDGEIRSFPLPGISSKNWLVLVSGFIFLFLMVLLSILFQI